MGVSPQRLLPAYTVSDVASYLRVPRSTLRAWALGQTNYPSPGRDPRSFKPLVRAAEAEPRALRFSFVNLVELHVLSALRRVHGLSLQKIRRALDYLDDSRCDTEHPLADLDLLTDGLEVWVEQLGQLVAASKEGQMGIKEVLTARLRRVDRDPRGCALRLYPFTRGDENPKAPLAVVIDPERGFGRPILAHAGISTGILVGRFRAGESPEVLAEDYGRSKEEIDEALRWALRDAA